MRKFKYMIGMPNPHGENSYAEVELDLNKEKVSKCPVGLVWLDQRDERYPAFRLIHPVN